MIRARKISIPRNAAMTTSRRLPDAGDDVMSTEEREVGVDGGPSIFTNPEAFGPGTGRPNPLAPAGVNTPIARRGRKKKAQNTRMRRALIQRMQRGGVPPQLARAFAPSVLQIIRARQTGNRRSYVTGVQSLQKTIQRFRG